jgi:hypothetical protein
MLGEYKWQSLCHRCETIGIYRIHLYTQDTINTKIPRTLSQSLIHEEWETEAEGYALTNLHSCNHGK